MEKGNVPEDGGGGRDFSDCAERPASDCAPFISLSNLAARVVSDMPELLIQDNKKLFKTPFSLTALLFFLKPMSVQLQKHLFSLKLVVDLPSSLIIHIELFLLWSDGEFFNQQGLLENKATLDSWRFVNKRTYADVEKIMYKSFLRIMGGRAEVNKKVYGSYWFQYWNLCNRCYASLPLINQEVVLFNNSKKRFCARCFLRQNLKACADCGRYVVYKGIEKDGLMCKQEWCTEFYCCDCLRKDVNTTTRSQACTFRYFCECTRQECAHCGQKTLCKCPECKPAYNWISFCANGWCTSRLCTSCLNKGEYCKSCQY